MLPCQWVRAIPSLAARSPCHYGPPPSLAGKCGACNGQGITFAADLLCRRCNGTAVKCSTRTVEVLVRPGAREGDVLVMEGLSSYHPLPLILVAKLAPAGGGGGGPLPTDRIASMLGVPVPTSDGAKAEDTDALLSLLEWPIAFQIVCTDVGVTCQRVADDLVFLKRVSLGQALGGGRIQLPHPLRRVVDVVMPLGEVLLPSATLRIKGGA